jgi:hypothetical protein
MSSSQSRGGKTVLEEVLLRVSRLVEGVHEIAGLALSQVFALPPGAGWRISDARLYVRPARRGATP